MISDKFTLFFSKLSPLVIILLSTLLVLAASVPIVYVFVKLFEYEYTLLFIILSVALPIILTPPIIYALLKLSHHLKIVQKLLHEEIEKNKSQELMLFEQARFAFMGEMMANVSHQWKQPLNTIGLAIVSMKTSGEKLNSEIEKKFDIMEDNINYLASTIDDFMSFFDNKSNSEMRELNDIVREIRSIVSIHLENNEIDFNIESDLKAKDIKIASSISQVLLNVLCNAKDSCLNDDGKRSISLKFMYTEEAFVLMCFDSGENIDESIKNKIFDPYFTTKPKNKGTGIGLYMSKQIVQKMFNGEISYKENPKCFYIELPYSKMCTAEDKK